MHEPVNGALFSSPATCVPCVSCKSRITTSTGKLIVNERQCIAPSIAKSTDYPAINMYPWRFTNARFNNPAVNFKLNGIHVFSAEKKFYGKHIDRASCSIRYFRRDKYVWNLFFSNFKVCCMKIMFFVSVKMLERFFTFSCIFRQVQSAGS